jgi:hypothetical protein
MRQAYSEWAALTMCWRNRLRIQTRAARLQNRVALFKALGGGVQLRCNL